MKTTYQIAVNIILVTGILFLLLIPACNRSREKKEPGSPVLKQEERKKTPAQAEKKEPETGASMPVVIGPVDTLTPELFVQITIQYRKEHKKWLQEAQELPPDKRSDFIEKANRDFFKSLGITEEEYIAYSQNNIDALNAYIEENPQLLPDVMDY